jgi:hypothetical protein
MKKILLKISTLMIIYILMIGCNEINNPAANFKSESYDVAIKLVNDSTLTSIDEVPYKMKLIDNELERQGKEPLTGKERVLIEVELRRYIVNKNNQQ